MADNDLQVQIKSAIKGIIEAVKPKAKVFSRWVIAEGIGESVPYFMSATETDLGTPWLHAYILGYDGFLREQVATASFHDTIQFKLWGFYGYKLGTEPVNSDDIFSVHLKDIQNALTKATKFQTVASPNGIPEVRSHGQWQIDKVGIYHMGTTKSHIAQGTIDVYTRLIINPTPIG